MIDVQRPPEAPASLAHGKSYRERDVLLALHATFLGKCYLCETPVEMGTFDVDHRRPKGDPRFADLEHAWANLFPTCTTYGCNGRRRKIYPDDGLLDPGEGVEARVRQRMDGAVSPALRRAGSMAFLFHAADPADAPARNTADELDRIHNGTESAATDKAAALRLAILDHVMSVTEEVVSYVALSLAPGADPATLDGRRQRVRRLVSRRAPYAMLVRSMFAALAPVSALFD